MEDRHALSEPRRNPSAQEGTINSPGWLVDIYRRGVEDPIDTIEISEETLPPRKKKGKIVWRLPSDYSRVPSFPVDERRRIMELFKERKKSRRKNKGNSNSSSSGGSKENGNVIPNINDERTHASNNTTNDLDGLEAKGNASALNTNNGARKLLNQIASSGQKHTAIKKKEEETSDNIINATLEQGQTSKKKKKRKDKMKRRLSQESAANESFSPSPQNGVNENISTSDDPDHTSLVEASNVIPSLPPGFQSTLSSLSLDKDRVDTSSHHDSNGGQDLSNHSLSDTTHSNANHQSLPVRAPLPGSRFITIPEHHRPPILSMSPQKSSLAIAAAKEFIEIYYPHITHSLPSDLANFYTPHAQKSISVGGAHSVVATRADIVLQLTSLSGSIFVVRGVVSQDAYDSRGVHVLVTGVVQTSGVTSQFAHSISLVPVPGHSEYSFQIHNDALSLLTSDGISQTIGNVSSPMQGTGVATSHNQHHGDNLASQGIAHPPGLDL